MHYGSWDWKTRAAVGSGLLTIVETGLTIVSYFGNVTASLFALTKKLENLRPRDPKQYRRTIVIPKQGLWVSLKFTNK